MKKLGQFDIESYGRKERIQLSEGSYANGQKAIVAMVIDDEGNEVEPYCKLTVCLVDEEQAKDEYFIKSYSENEQVYDQLREQGFLCPPHRFVWSGYARIPVCRIVKGVVYG